MNVLFRVDASIEIGTGHVMRCLALAEGLKGIDADIFFVCRESRGDLSRYIEEKGFTLFRLAMSNSNSEDAKETIDIILKNKIQIDWLIIDHYSIDICWEKQLYQYTNNIMVIDDLTNRKHYCDVILNQNYSQDINRYKDLVPATCHQLLGFKYALIRSEFKYARQKVKGKDGSIKKVLVFFGGTDQTNETEKVLKAISLLNNNLIEAEVIVGINNNRKESIKQLCTNNRNYIYRYHINNMAEIMNSVDLAICSGGSITLERYCLGLPAITIAVADNQVDIAKNGSILGIDFYLGRFEEVNAEMISFSLSEINKSTERLKNSSILASKLVDGYGVERVISFLEGKR